MNVAVLTPARSDGGRRDQLLDWTSKRLASLHPDFQHCIGTHDDGPFNRSLAVNRAATQAPDADVFVLADGDSFVGAEALNAAVQLAADTGCMVLAYDQFMYLGRSMTDKVMDGFTGNWHEGAEWSLTGTCSSMVVFPAGLFREIGGCDEGFVGWGGEDIALSHALQTFGGGLHRIPGEVWHLWHPPAIHTHDDTWPQRCELYHQAAYDKPRMRALLDRIKDDPSAT